MKKTLLLLILIISFFTLNAQTKTETDSIPDKKGLFDYSLEELMELKVYTSSKFKQDITDAPGVVTVITRDEIEKMGYRTLVDILMTLPGFSLVQNDDELLVAVRGIYSTTNQKFLILRDGHIINDFLFDRVDIGYSFSLDNVKKIEVIRGPSASLYGTAAVTSVINIITEDGDKSRAKVTTGNNGQKQLDLVYSKKGKNTDFFSAYLHFADIGGERKQTLKEDDYTANPDAAKDGVIYISNYPKNMDAGVRFKKGILQSSFALRNYEYNVHWGLFGQNINRDSLFIKPAFKTLNVHYDLTLNKSFLDNKFYISAQHFYDYNNVSDTKVILTGNEYGNEAGKLLTLGWTGYRTGLNYSGGYNYDAGNIIVGFMIENRLLDESYFMSNWGVDRSVYEYSSTPLLPVGSEVRGAAYTQLHHGFLDNKFIINAGLRYDFNNEFDPTFNPRIALIGKPTKKLTLKTVYTRAFQAPAYFYRKSNPNLGYGSTDKLNAEIMTSFQGIARYNFTPLSFVEMTYFHNTLDNFIRRNADVYQNLGSAVIQGLEIESRIKVEKFNFFANYTLLSPVESGSDEVYTMQNIKDGKLKHIPQHTMNAGLGYAPIEKFSVRVWTRWTSEFTSQARTSTEPNREVSIPSNMLLNLALTSKNILPSLGLTFTIYNLTDKEYKLGDPATPSPIFQQGRWLTMSVSYDF